MKILRVMLSCIIKHNCTFASNILFENANLPDVDFAKMLALRIIWNLPESLIPKESLCIEYNGVKYYLIDLSFNSLSQPIPVETRNIIEFLKLVKTDEEILNWLLEDWLLDNVTPIEILYSNPNLLYNAISQMRF